MAAAPKEILLGSSVEDRRQGKRMPLHCPVEFFRQNHMILASTTENVSKSGFYCRVNERLTPGEEFDCFLRLPEASPSGGTASLVLACRCRLARIEVLGADWYGVAFQIDDYLIIAD